MLTSELPSFSRNLVFCRPRRLFSEEPRNSPQVFKISVLFQCGKSLVSLPTNQSIDTFQMEPAQLLFDATNPRISQ